MTRTPFGHRLRTAMADHGQLCVGIDPHPKLLAQWGLADDINGLRQFSLTMVEAAAGRAAAIKPQSALFERHGARGVGVLAEVIAAARGWGILCIVDAKRGDIGSTMDGYAAAYLSDHSDLAGDAVTLSPYLGFGSLQPALELAEQTGRGVFVLCLTSNPEGAGVQHAINPQTGRAIAADIAAAAAAENQAALGSWAQLASKSPTDASQRCPEVGASLAHGSRGAPLGSVGLVVGATVGTAVSDLGIDLAAVNGPLLAPGIGAQGAGATELRQVFGAARPNVLASSSREILAEGPQVADIRQAIQRSRDDVMAALSA